MDFDRGKNASTYRGLRLKQACPMRRCRNVGSPLQKVKRRGSQTVGASSPPPDRQSRFQINRGRGDAASLLFSSAVPVVACFSRTHGDVLPRRVAVALLAPGALRAPVRGKRHRRRHDGGERAGEAGENVLETGSFQTSEDPSTMQRAEVPRDRRFV